MTECWNGRGRGYGRFELVGGVSADGDRYEMHYEGIEDKVGVVGPLQDLPGRQ